MRSLPVMFDVDSRVLRGSGIFCGPDALTPTLGRGPGEARDGRFLMKLEGVGPVPKRFPGGRKLHHRGSIIEHLRVIHLIWPFVLNSMHARS